MIKTFKDVTKTAVYFYNKIPWDPKWIIGVLRMLLMHSRMIYNMFQYISCDLLNKELSPFFVIITQAAEEKKYGIQNSDKA